MKKGLSILITPTDSHNSRHLFLSKWQINIIILLFLALSFIIVFAVVNYAKLSYKALEAEILRRRNAQIEGEFAKIQELKKHLEIAESDNQKIKVMLGIKQAPAPVQLVITEVSENYQAKRDSISAKENIPALLPTMGQISKRFESGHKGIDIAAPLFSPVITAASGTVSAIGWDSIYGNYIVIEHSKSYATFYGHLNSIVPRKGDDVNGGEVIGTVGSSGKSTSSHLHYEVRFLGKPVDPMAYLPYFVEK